MGVLAWCFFVTVCVVVVASSCRADVINGGAAAAIDVNTTCAGCVGSTCYNLTALARAVVGESSCTDRDQNTYFYRVCGWSSHDCATPTDPKPVVCQRDSRMPPDMHDLGSSSKFQWVARAAGEDTGFILHFQGGSLGRQTDIEFICDKNAGTGRFEAADPSESPMLHYHLMWTTKYACPVTPPPAGVRCCTYQDKQYHKDTQSLCVETSERCLSLGDNFVLVTNRTAANCEECKGATTDSACCVYEDAKDHAQLSSQCVAHKPSSNCPATSDDGHAKLIGSYRVTNCTNCFVTRK